ncbi:hypothetical protein AALP_AAs40850U000100 [Arabis alpina]|uniref:Uncharacterized protein n=1 Tax=Arabis alpina TaxID=50452 RepID=A0A087G367_ARAAL|nr:hypothetical protein AALP_AAs40850U000100 [Arabis alpina]
MSYPESRLLSFWFFESGDFQWLCRGLGLLLEPRSSLVLPKLMGFKIVLIV